MPFKWKQNRNPYRYNYFNILRIGPQATSAQLVQRGRQLSQEHSVGQCQELDCVEITEHDIAEASTKLRDPRTKIEEMLLVHAPALKDKKRLKSLISSLEKLSSLPDTLPEFVVANPMAVFWFIQDPVADSVVLPAWEELGFCVAGDEQDSKMDIVFDQ